MRRLTLLTSLMIMSLLSACGGGGSDGGGGPVTYAALNAWDNLFARTRTWTLVGTSQGHALVLNAALRVQSAAIFPGTGASGNRRAFEVRPADRRRGRSASGTTTYFLDGNNALMGATGSDGTCVIVRSGRTAARPVSMQAAQANWPPGTPTTAAPPAPSSWPRAPTAGACRRWAPRSTSATSPLAPTSAATRRAKATALRSMALAPSVPTRW